MAKRNAMVPHRRTKPVDLVTGILDPNRDDHPANCNSRQPKVSEMVRNGIVAAAALWATLSVAIAQGQSPDLPHWIWAEPDSAQEVRFERDFRVERNAVSATLRCAGHSAGLTVRIDQQRLATLEPYDPLCHVDVTTLIGKGDHRLTVNAQPVSGPSAFFLVLDVVFDDGSTQIIRTDRSWSTGTRRQDRSVQPEDSPSPSADAEFKVIDLGQVDSRLVIPRDRQVGITALDNYEQWKQALGGRTTSDPASFQLTPGFEIQLLHTATETEGSWVSMAVDDQQRLIIAKESQGLLRMTLSPNLDRVVKSEPIEATLKECRGLAFVGKDLYANANNSKGLYRLRALDDDSYAAPELVLETSGGVGHGRNDLAIGPNGKIFSIHGDAVRMPPSANDVTSPFRESNRGNVTSEGHLLRIDPQTDRVELLAGGLRNPYGIDFHPNGDLFTYDADAEHDMGAPWYRPTRVSMLVPGGDYGWRGVTGSWPSYYPDHSGNALPSLDIGKGSPTAVKFGTRSDFPKRYREAFFILDWAYGRIVAVHLLPRGASYLMTAETFLKGRPLNVTDLDFASDGSMLLVTGGRKTQSSLYRIRYVGDRDEKATPISRQGSRQAKFAAASRAKRLQMEKTLLDNQATSADIDALWSSLQDADPWIRQATRHLLEQIDVERWRASALQESDRPVAVRSLLSLARSGNRSDSSKIVQRLNRIAPHLSSVSDKLTLCQAYSLCLLPEWIESHPERAGQTRKVIERLYPDRSFLVNRSLGDLAVRIGASDVVAKTMTLLRETTDPIEKLQHVYVLRNCSQGWTPEDRDDYFRALSQSTEHLIGAGMSKFISKITEEATATLDDKERQRLQPLLAASEPTDLPVVTTPRPFVRRWTVKELIDAKPDHEHDLERGKKTFVAASCANCHRVGLFGRPVGPDLTLVGRRFSRRDLLTSLIEPSAVIADSYRSVQILTKDGTTHVGQVLLGGDYRSTKLRLATDAKSLDKIIDIDKNEIEARKDSPVSWMPTGLLDSLTRPEIEDLLHFISQGGIRANRPSSR